MLYFAHRPDPVFAALVDAALRHSLDEIADNLGSPDADPEWWAMLYPRSAPCFTPARARATLDDLLAAHRASELYEPTAYHWLVLYECLEVYCAHHNDELLGMAVAPAHPDSQPDGCWPVGAYRIGRLDLDQLVNEFFHDTDFLMDPQVVTPVVRARLLVEDEVFGVVHGLAPHAAELRLTPTRGVPWPDEDRDSIWATLAPPESIGDPRGPTTFHHLPLEAGCRTCRRTIRQLWRQTANRAVPPT
jgi:hypothetical protein